MSPPPPTRVLGNGGTDASDNPYAPADSAPGSNEIDSLEDAPTETTTLLPPPPQPYKVAPRFDNTGASTVTQADPEAPTRRRRQRHRPWRLKISFGVACLLLYVNFSFLLLVSISTTSPFFAHNALPSHYGSTFLPIWLSFLALIVNALALLAFVAPLESPHFAAQSSLIAAFLCFVQLILILAVAQLRRGENVLTLVTLGIAIVSLLHAAASALLVERYAPFLQPPPPRAEIPEPGFVNSLVRFSKATVSFVGVSLPIVVLHIAIVVAFALLTLTICIRAVDASFEMDGHRWKVNPWRQRNGHGVLELNGRPYWLHLACRGVEVQPISQGGVALIVQDADPGLNATRKGPPTVRRTILVEADRGVPGKVGASWVMKMLEEGLLTSADTEARVCFYDRPGYGFSENSPTSSTAHIVTALSQALSLSGEMARLEPSPSFVPSPTARSGFILVSHSYGALISTLFASLHPRLVHSALYLSPTSPAFQFSPASSHSGFLHAVKFFFTSGLGAWVEELGVRKIWSALRGQAREHRVYSTAAQGLKGELGRAWVQEEAERSSTSNSALAWANARTRYPERPTIVFSASARRGVPRGTWLESQEAFVKDLVGDGLVSWEQAWDGTCGDGTREGEGACRKALTRLFKAD